MKLILSILLLAYQFGYSQNKIYDLSVDLPNGQTISMAKFKGTKILVTVCGAESLQNKGMVFLDSLIQEFPDIQVLIFPAEDLGNAPVEDSLLAQKMPDNKQLMMLSSSAVKSEKLPKTPVVEFLTNVKQNMHFDLGIISEFQLFIIDESGELYAVLTNQFPLKALDEALRYRNNFSRIDQKESF